MEPTKAPISPDRYQIPDIPDMLPINNRLEIPIFADAPIPQVRQKRINAFSEANPFFLLSLQVRILFKKKFDVIAIKVEKVWAYKKLNSK